jgi:hypothetical protein
MTTCATPPFLNQIFYKNKTFDENYEILQSKYAFTTTFKTQVMATVPIPKIPCMTPTAAAPPHPHVKQGISTMPSAAAAATATADMSDHITINPYTKCTSKPTPPAPAARAAPKPKTLYDPSPVAADTLFWSIYIGMYGWGEFEHIRNNYALAEITEKAKIAAFLDAPENQKKLKETKYRVSKGGVREIQSDCHTQASTTGFSVVVAMSVFYEKNIWLVDEDRHIFLRFDGRPTEDEQDQTKNPCMIIYRGISGGKGNAAKYTVETCPTGILGLVDRIRTEFVCLDHYESTIKAASNYKMDDLEDMARRLKVDLTANAKWKKIDLYDTIKQKCVWQR